MREILQLQVGQCGNQAGSHYWQTLYRHFGLDEKGVCWGERPALQDRISVHFTEERDTTWSSRYLPRSVLVDLEPGVVERITRETFRPENCVTSQSGAGNNWARAHYGEGAEMLDQVEDVVRREVERCELLQGFQLCHSIGGGTGSGLGSLMLRSLSDQYSGRIVHTFSVLPSQTVSSVEPYNAGLTLHHLLQHSHGVFCADNKALSAICSSKLNIARPAYSHLNNVLARMMSGVSLDTKTDMRKLTTSLVPLPRLQFFISSLAPLGPQETQQVGEQVGPLVKELFDGSNVLTDCQVRQASYLTVSASIRGRLSMLELGQHLGHMLDSRSQCFVPWIPDNVILSCDGEAKSASGTVVGNSTAIVQPLRRISSKFSEMARRKAFLHTYITEGMEEAEFSEALDDMDNLISEYEICHNTAEDVSEWLCINIFSLFLSRRCH